MSKSDAKRSSKIYADDMMLAVMKIEKYTKGMTLKSFISDSMAFDAVIRNFEVLGEAAGRIDKTTRAKNSGVPWSKIIGLRNIAIHEYFGIDKSIIWNIIQNNIPELKKSIIRLRNSIK